MKIPIPTDWNGDTFECYTIQWPNSPEWRSILRGLILSPARGRFWDERSGSVSGAQIVGLQIDTLNLPLTTCDGLIVPCTEPTIPRGGDFDLDNLEFCACEDDDMACTDCPPIKIENGSLYWFNCGEWQLVGDIGGAPQPEVVDPWPNDENGDPPTLSACGKAKAVYDAVLAVANGFDAAGGEPPWKWVGRVESELPGYDLKNTWVVSGVLALINLLALYELEEIFNDYKLGSSLCRLVSIFGADQAGITDEQFAAIKQVFTSEFGLILSQPYTVAINAIGQTSLSTIAKLGASDTTADCDCPEFIPPPDETVPDANGWYWSVPLPDVDIFVPNSGAKIPCFTWQLVKETFALKYDVFVETNLNYKSMSMPAGSGINQACGDTGENFPGQPAGVQYNDMFLHSSSAFKTTVLGAGVGTLIGGATSNYTSTDPAAPSAIGVSNAHVGYAVAYTFNGPGWLHFTNIRLLHNINSAHGGQ